MTDDREIMQMALKALEVLTDNYDDNAVGIEIDAIIALRARLTQPEKEPVAVGIVCATLLPPKDGDHGRYFSWLINPKDIPIGARLYTAPPQRKPLTDEEKLIDLLEAARETFKKSPSGSECSQNAAYVHSVLETMLIKREWQGLTDEEISAISKSIPGETDLGAAKRLFAREIEAKLKEKNT